jgi:hypothetical protein
MGRVGLDCVQFNGDEHPLPVSLRGRHQRPLPLLQPPRNPEYFTFSLFLVLVALRAVGLQFLMHMLLLWCHNPPTLPPTQVSCRGAVAHQNLLDTWSRQRLMINFLRHCSRPSSLSPSCTGVFDSRRRSLDLRLHRCPRPYDRVYQGPSSAPQLSSRQTWGRKAGGTFCVGEMNVSLPYYRTLKRVRRLASNDGTHYMKDLGYYAAFTLDSLLALSYLGPISSLLSSPYRPPLRLYQVMALYSNQHLIRCKLLSFLPHCFVFIANNTLQLS